MRQGQIGEIIGAKPQARRLILEEAAGISGLHSRRHEAELRLKGAEDNLLRVEDVLKQIDGQVESLRRQARQSSRYKALATEIRKHTALAHLIAWRAHETHFADARRKLDADGLEVAERTRAQGEAARLQAIAAANLPGLRDAEAHAGAALHRITLAREALAAEEKRAEARKSELERRLAQFARDLEHEEALIADAAGVGDRLATEDAALGESSADEVEAAALAHKREEEAQRRLVAVEAELTEAQTASSELNARRNALGVAAVEEGRRLARLEADLASVVREFEALSASGFADDEHALRGEAAAELAFALEEAESATIEAEAVHAEARQAETRSRGPLAEAERAAQRLETEVRTLVKLLGSGGDQRFPPVVDTLTVARGLEAALGAALGDDLDAPVDEAAPAHWSVLASMGDDPALPNGVEPLAAHVSAPPALARRLAQIGVVPREDGKRLAALLLPGQRLVSREGDLWRWDGFVAAADAPTPAARRLAEKNRLADLEREAEEARRRAERRAARPRKRPSASRKPPPPRRRLASTSAPPAPLPTAHVMRSRISSASAPRR